MPKNFSDEEECTPQSDSFLVSSKDKYFGRSIKYCEYPDRYDLIFADEFNGDMGDSALFADLLNDLKESDKTKELHLWVNSVGGTVSILMMLSELIAQFEYVVSIGLGEIDSAGFNFWCLGKEKYIGEHTVCMYHSMSCENFGKAAEIKEFSSFIGRYQDIFEKMVDSVLTPKEIERGSLTEVFLLGRELIDRGVALPFSHYAKRESFEPIEAYRFCDDVYVRTDGGYFLASMNGDLMSRSKIISDRIELTRVLVDVEETARVIGIKYVQFFQMYIDLNIRRLKGGLFVGKEKLLSDWKNYDEEDIGIEEIFQKFLQWISSMTSIQCITKDDGIILTEGPLNEEKE